MARNIRNRWNEVIWDPYSAFLMNCYFIIVKIFLCSTKMGGQVDEYDQAQHDKIQELKIELGDSNTA